MSAAAARAAQVPADPRPAVVEDGGRRLLAGGRCVRGHALTHPRPRCPRCRAEVAPERFGPGGAIWAVTVVHVPAHEGDEVPYTLAYVDLDDGPRLLVRLDAPGGARVGDRVALTAPTAEGNPAAEVAA